MKALDEHILTRYFAEEASSDELALVNKWLKSDKNNELELKAYHAIWSASQKPQKTFKIDVDAAWKNVASKTEAKTKPKNFLRIAAAVVGVLLLSTYFLVNSNSNTELLSLKSEKASELKTLADGSTITLNSFSLLEYPDAFDGNERRIKLIGEAFFDIKPNPDKPFIIEANGTEIRVLGTSFNIFARDEDVKVSVKSGVVEFSKTAAKKVILEKNEEATYESLRDTLKISPILDRNVFAHKTKIFEFNDTELTEVVAILNKGYQSNILLTGNNWTDYMLTTRFENENLSDALGIIAETLDLDLKNSGKSFIFAKKTANE